MWDTVGGGNLEAVAIERARELLAAGATSPELVTSALSDKAPFQHGVQCCGGEVTLLLEPLPVVPAVAIFGMGHVGLELARILARHDLELHLVDSRPDQLTDERLAPMADARANVHVHQVPVLPELVLSELPTGTHVLMMTHDHAEDAALCDAALRTDGLGSIGLIGSSAKWVRFQQKLAAEGHSPDDDRADHHAHRASWPRRQGAGNDRRERGRVTVARIREGGILRTMTLFRADVLDTPGNPFSGAALRASSDEGIHVRDGEIVARGPFTSSTSRGEEVVNLEGGLLLPGFVDTHVHYPQVRVIGGLGMPLLDWLEQCALPEEARLADSGYAQQVAAEFVSGLTAAGTTTRTGVRRPLRRRHG